MTPHTLAQASERAYRLPPTLTTNGVEVRITRHGAATVVAFRGTDKDGWDILTDIRFLPWWSRLGFVHSGFWKGVREIWPLIEKHLEKMEADPKRVYYTGHSKGGGEATHAAALHKRRWGAIGGLVTFAKPRCGRSLERLFAPDEILRFVIPGDPVPHFPLPGFFYSHEFDPEYLDGPDGNPAIWEMELHKIALYVERTRNVT